MIAQMATVVLLLCVASSAALAQRDRPPRFPAEKFSTSPVQPAMNELPARLSLAANPDRSPVVQTPWVKSCGKDPIDPHGNAVCLTLKEIRLRSHTGPFLAGVALIESAGEDKKILRVTLPSDVQQSEPVRLRLDDGAARSGALARCHSNGCMWDFAADAAFVALLKSRARLHIEGTAASGEIASYDLPLGGFATPMDVTVLKEKHRWEERSRDPSVQPR